RASLALAHGKAALNDNYATLLHQAWKGQVFDEDGDGGSSHALVVVNQWLRGRKRAGLADFVVGTIDQSLFAALKAKHVVLRHLGLAGKVVIIDEVHAADDYMREYLKRLLGWLGAYRTPVILMSATLPPSQREEFRNAYAQGLDGETRDLPETDDYPRISVGNAADEIHVPSEARQVEVGIRQLADDPAALTELLDKALADGGCAAVICNTVRRAQQTFASLVDVFGDVRLVHSRFIAPERARREADLVRALGPDGSLRPARLIVVGTQVLEQSLDVDFDLMISDLAPVDLLLQRAGRLHRHDRPDRPSPLRQPVLWLRGVQDWSAEPPAAVRGSTAVYGAQRLLAAAAVLQGLPSVRFPQDIPRLVRIAYDAPQVPAEWEAAWADAQEAETTRRRTAVARAQTYLLGAPWESGNLNGLIDVISGDPDRLEEQGKSQVRDGGEGLEVMALRRGDDNYLRLLDGAVHLPGRVVPEGLQWGTADDERLAREMAACTLRLPAAMCYPGVIEGVIRDLERLADYSGWQ
ncbi:MAG: CRISPR-associated helicase Cas3', partial [Propionicimonas sp.]|nr:CRISPR-associated helicase Cas3' [Propionicimonas sp.]